MRNTGRGFAGRFARWFAGSLRFGTFGWDQVVGLSAVITEPDKSLGKRRGKTRNVAFILLTPMTTLETQETLGDFRSQN